MINIHDALALLSQERPVFHSEADFQHALGWLIHLHEPHASVRLEYRPLPLEPLYLDVWIQNDQGVLAFELKYATRRLAVDHAGEHFALKNRAAQDITRYDFVKDIGRLERIVAARPGVTGYAILLTNDSTYWTRSMRERTMDAAFRLYEGASLSGSLGWSVQAASGTIAKREPALHLQGSYLMSWHNYSTVGSHTTGGHFRFLVVRVDGSTVSHRS
jgi:hypothetical protein